MSDIDFNPDPETLTLDYLDAFEGVQSEILYTAKHGEDYDFGTAYMGISNMMG